MAQQTSSTPQVTSTNGRIHTNQPINPQTIVRAESVKVRINDGRDKNLYPAILMEIEDEGKQFWYYALGDEATRDSDYTALDAAICPPSNNSPILFDAVVDAGGDGDYLLVSEAQTAGACSIFVRAGVYNEVASWVMEDACIVVGESSGVVINFPSGLGVTASGGGVDKTAGTITVANDSDVVTGVGTSFADTDIGRTIQIGFDFFTIIGHTSNTIIQIEKPWRGDADSGLEYSIRDYKKGIILDTLTLVGASGGANDLIDFDRVLSSSLRNLSIQDSDQDNISLRFCGYISGENLLLKNAARTGLAITTSTGVKMSKVVSNNNTTNGISLSDVKSTSVNQSIANNNKVNGVEVLGTFLEVNLSQVNASYNNDRGIDGDNTGTKLTIDSCNLIANGGVNIVSQSQRTIISNCNIKGKGQSGGGTGIQVTVNAATITGNFIEDCESGILLGITSQGSTVSGNRAINCTTCYRISNTNSNISANVAQAYAAGFFVDGTNNNLTSNLAIDPNFGNMDGFRVLGDGNVLSTNFAKGNTDGFQIESDNNTLIGNVGQSNTNDFNITGTGTIFGVITEEPIKLWNIDTATRNALTASNGWMIYNTDTNKGQIYAGGVWVDLH